MLFLIGTFGLNFPIFISTMSVSAFHAGAGQFGLLTLIMAIGSVTGALLAARRVKPRLTLLLAILLAIALGGTPFGAPIVGWVADHFGPRWALGVGASAGFAAALVGLAYLSRYRNLRVTRDAGRLRVRFDE